MPLLQFLHDEISNQRAFHTGATLTPTETRAPSVKIDVPFNDRVSLQNRFHFVKIDH